MDLRSGETYATRGDAERAGVPASDVAEVRPGPPGHVPQVRVTKGPFKGRTYVRNGAGQLVRVDAGRRRPLPE